MYIFTKIIETTKKYRYILILLLLIILMIISLLYFLIFFYQMERIDKPNLYCFWTGNNPLTENRKRNLKTLVNTGFNVKLITPDNLNEYILPEHPIHDGYQYLSETHKSDYLRCYFMHFYGGGYSDIKRIDESWMNQYIQLMNSDKWACGYAERSSGDIAYGSNEKINQEMKNNYSEIIGNGQYIFKSNTPLTNEWYKQMMELMDEKYNDLKKYPSKNVTQVYSKEYPYPLEWNELLGRIYHPFVYKYKDKILKNLPYVNTNNYR